MTLIVIGLMIFVICLFVLEMCFYAYKVSGSAERRKTRKRFKTVSSLISKNKTPEILEKRVLSEVPFINLMLSRIRVVERLERLVKQANVKHTLGFFVLVSLLLASMAYLSTTLIKNSQVLGVMFAVPLGATPLLYLLWKRKKRMRKLQIQLPDGLDMIARALKAGHAFSTGMKLAADEFDDPLGAELTETMEEINFGVSVSDALANLAKRLDSPDIQYFVVSVLIQRTTGGNLAEILETIASLIRERIKFQGKVRVLAAEGKFSAVILIALPFIFVLILRFLNPRYISLLWTDPIGRVICSVVAIMMILGALVMKKIVNIEI